MTRQEHMAWAKARAQEYVKAGDVTQAYASLVSDLNKHRETQGHPAIQLGMMQMLNGHLDSQEKMRQFIDGFN